MVGDNIDGDLGRTKVLDVGFIGFVIVGIVSRFADGLSCLAQQLIEL